MGTVNHGLRAILARSHRREGQLIGGKVGLVMSKISAQLVFAVTVIIVSSQLAIAAPKETDQPNIDQVKGRKIFAKHCAGCHGPEGKGDGYLLLGPDPANLTRPTTKKKPDALLLQTIHEGKPNMPSWKGRLSDNESRAVLAYIRALKK